jgi:hypothetical protein
MEDFGKFYGHLVYFTAIWYSSWLFGTFFQFWYVVTKKIWQPWVTLEKEGSGIRYTFYKPRWQKNSDPVF